MLVSWGYATVATGRSLASAGHSWCRWQAALQRLRRRYRLERRLDGAGVDRERAAGGEDARAGRRPAARGSAVVAAKLVDRERPVACLTLGADAISSAV